MRRRADNFTQVCRRMQALMQEAAPVAAVASSDRLNDADAIHRLSLYMALRQPA